MLAQKCVKIINLFFIYLSVEFSFNIISFHLLSVIYIDVTNYVQITKRPYFKNTSNLLPLFRTQKHYMQAA